MTFLYEKINTLKEAGLSQTIPQYLIDNLSSNIKLRDYQKTAMENLLLYLNSELCKNKQTHLLYHMATGSGKTVIMAMNILYYYKKGYRNFLFFTNHTNIVSKTKINFLEKHSSKYLFSNNLNIDGKNINICEVENFENASKENINICFNTVQGIHSSLSLIKEGSLTLDDFENEKIVLIADEAHHLNSTTIKDKEENETNATWEDTVNRILYANKDNVLLEYTATCDTQDPNVKKKYLDKIIYNFDLKEFRAAGYTKEFFNLRSNTTKWVRTLQALILSEYRKLLFESHNCIIKPVVLLKSKTIADSNIFYKEFYENLPKLSINEIESIKNSNVDTSFLKNAFDYFEQNDLDIISLIELIRNDFSVQNSINMNELTSENENIVNNLDEKDNHIRLVFIVDKLTEGWDVLSLFDIVRLYETRQGGPKGAVSKYTIKEAQLIGRGARYCPFVFEKSQAKEKRKYSDYANPLSICETLLYHAMDDAKYINEIKKALQQTGLLPETETIQVCYELKEDFKKTRIYQEGLVFLNERIEVNRNKISSLPEKIKTQGITFKCQSSHAFSTNLMENGQISSTLKYKDETPIHFKTINYSILHKGYRCFYNTLSFDKLKKQFPHLKSVKEFLTSGDYLGDFPITFSVLENEKVSVVDQLEAAKKVLQIISDYVQSIEITYVGTKEFQGHLIRDAFTDRIRNVTRDSNDVSWGNGISQRDSLVDPLYRIDLQEKDWYAYSDNYGTSEEKKFVKYFSTIIDDLKKIFNSIYLIRNEIQVCLYSFKDGSKFEPDYVLILNKKLEERNINDKENIYICMFIEPKGEHLLEKDKWKNTFLLELEKESIPIVKFIDNNEYKIWGTPLYNEVLTKAEFKSYFSNFIKQLEEN